MEMSADNSQFTAISIPYLVNVDEEGLEDCDLEIVGGISVANVPQLWDHLLLHVGVLDVVTLKTEKGEKL